MTAREKGEAFNFIYCVHFNEEKLIIIFLSFRQGFIPFILKYWTCTIRIPYFLCRPESSSFGARKLLLLLLFGFDILDIFRVKTGTCRLGSIRVILFRFTILKKQSWHIKLDRLFKMTDREKIISAIQMFLFFLHFPSVVQC